MKPKMSKNVNDMFWVVSNTYEHENVWPNKFWVLKYLSQIFSPQISRA